MGLVGEEKATLKQDKVVIGLIELWLRSLLNP